LVPGWSWARGRKNKDTCPKKKKKLDATSRGGHDRSEKKGEIPREP